MSLTINNNRPARRKPGGLSQEEAERIEREFTTAMEPLGQKATEYFRCFDLNGKRYFLILPAVETYEDIPIEKKAYILKYKSYFVSEISKVELDEMPFL